MFSSKILTNIFNIFSKKSNGISHIKLTMDQAYDLEQMLSAQESVLSNLFQTPCDDCWAIFADSLGYEVLYIDNHKEYDFNNFEYFTKNGFKHLGYIDSVTYKKYYPILSVRTNTNTCNVRNNPVLKQNH